MAPGSKNDMAIAYVFRAFTVILQGVAVLGLWALFQLGMTIRDDTRDIKKEWPDMKKDIGELKEQGKTFATKIQLESAEQRVKAQFAEELKKSQVITTTQPIPGR